tara:strand:- start:1505 stop:1684 length:180 start_codon:yes stop_codon:yes gene_type:complete
LQNPIKDLPENTLSTIDWTSIGILIASWIKFLPDVAALLTILWTVLRFYDRYWDKDKKD